MQMDPGGAQLSEPQSHTLEACRPQSALVQWNYALHRLSLLSFSGRYEQSTTAGNTELDAVTSTWWIGKIKHEHTLDNDLLTEDGWPLSSPTSHCVFSEKAFEFRIFYLAVVISHIQAMHWWHNIVFQERLHAYVYLKSVLKIQTFPTKWQCVAKTFHQRSTMQFCLM